MIQSPEIKPRCPEELFNEFQARRALKEYNDAARLIEARKRGIRV